MSVLDDLRRGVIDGNAPGVQDSVKQAIGEGLPPDRAHPTQIGLDHAISPSRWTTRA